MVSGVSGMELRNCCVVWCFQDGDEELLCCLMLSGW